MLAGIYERRRFVWAKINGNDKQEIVDRVNEAFAAAGFDGTVTVSDLMGEIREVRKDVAGVREDTQALLQGQGAMVVTMQQILAQMEANKKSLTDPTQHEWPPELIEQAKILRERGDKEQRAVAEIALRNHKEADRLIQELKADTISAAFGVLTLEGDNFYEANEPDKAIRPYEQALALQPDDFVARTNAMIAHATARLDDIATHRHRAIEIAERTLSLLPPTSTHWARTQNDLGNTWQSMPTGDPADNLRRAIDAYEAALTVFTKVTYPAEWAGTLSNLGNLWRVLPTGDKHDNLHRALDAFEAALTVYTKSAYPAKWAGNQNNLGIVLSDIVSGDRADNLHRAIDAFIAALSVYTKIAYPMDWAMTQHNLGVAIYLLPTGVRADNLRRAIGVFEDTLTVRTKAADPASWAMTQNNLGVAWEELGGEPDEDTCECLWRSVASWKGALTVYTPKVFPIDHAKVVDYLDVGRKAYESRGCTLVVPFDDIPPAE